MISKQAQEASENLIYAYRHRNLLQENIPDIIQQAIDSSTKPLIEALEFYARLPEEVPNALDITSPGNMNDWNRIISSDGGHAAREALK